MWGADAAGTRVLLRRGSSRPRETFPLRAEVSPAPEQLPKPQLRMIRPCSRGPRPKGQPDEEGLIPMRLPPNMKFPSVPTSGAGRRETELSRARERNGSRRAAAAAGMTRAGREACCCLEASARGVTGASAEQAGVQRTRAGACGPLDPLLLPHPQQRIPSASFPNQHGGIMTRSRPRSRTSTSSVESYSGLKRRARPCSSVLSHPHTAVVSFPNSNCVGEGARRLGGNISLARSRREAEDRRVEELALPPVAGLRTLVRIGEAIIVKSDPKITWRMRRERIDGEQPEHVG